MHTYYITVKHDNGKFKVKATATDEAAAKQQVMDFENCPERAIIKIELKEGNENGN